LVYYPHPGLISDGERCAEIVSLWINRTRWMPRLFTKNQLLKMIKRNFLEREIRVLCIEKTSKGDGKVFLYQVTREQKYLFLLSHIANEKVHRF
tara:strand:+ start:30 stop:311 length:282 start_codon:yes stop_codon:yes gene_type:complete